MSELRSNKGQTLVFFILLLPIFFLFMAMIVDLGNLRSDKKEVDRTIKNAIEYGLLNQENMNLENEINKLLYLNIDNIQSKEILIESDKIEITVNKKIDYAFPLVINNNIENYIVTYRGYLENGNVKIVRG